MPELRNSWADLRDGDFRYFCLLEIDLAGHSEILSRATESRMRVAVDAFRNYVSDVVSNYGGRVWVWAGDGGRAAFYEDPDQIVDAAASAAFAILEGLNRLNAEVPIDQELRARLAIHAGNITYREDKGAITSEVINTAAHLEKRSLPNTVSITDEAYARLADHRDRFTPAGTFNERPYFLGTPDLQQTDASWLDRRTYDFDRDPGDRHALVIGVGRYQDPAIPNLRYASEDARKVRDVLIQNGGFPEENVSLLTDEDASFTNIRVALYDLQTLTDQDLLFVYFAGHGSPGVQRQALTGQDRIVWKSLVPTDGLKDKLVATSLSLDELHRVLTELTCKRVALVLDSCYSGEGGRSVSAFHARGGYSDEAMETLADEGRAVISASSDGELAYEPDELGHGLFSEYLIRGLSGEADTDGDGVVDVDELFGYISRNVSTDAHQRGLSQTPQLRGGGSVYIPLAFPSRTFAPRTDPFDEAADLISRRQLQRARTTLDRLDANDPRHPLLSGNLSLAEEDFITAEAAFETALGQNARAVDAYAGLSQALLGQDRYAECVETIRKAIAIDASHRALLGPARLAVEQALAEQPDRADNRFCLASIYGLDGLAGRASEHILIALESWPVEDIASARRRIESDDALYVLRQDTRYGRVQRALEEREEILRRLEEAITEAQRALEESDLDSAERILDDAAAILESTRVDDLRSAVRSQRDEARAMVVQSENALQADDLDRAEEAAAAAVRLDIDVEGVDALREQIGSRRERKAEIADLRHRAQALIDAGDREAAIGVLDQLQAQLPDDDDVRTRREGLASALEADRRFAGLIRTAEEHLATGAFQMASEALDHDLELSPAESEEVDRLRARIVKLHHKSNLDRFDERRLAYQWAMEAFNEDVGAGDLPDYVTQRLHGTGMEPIDHAAVVERVSASYTTVVSEYVKDTLDEANHLLNRDRPDRALDIVARAAARVQHPDILSLKKRASDAVENKQRLQNTLRKSRRGIAEGDYLGVVNLIAAEPEWVRKDPTLRTLAGQAANLLKATQAFRRSIELAEDRESEGKLEDALYLLMRVADRVSISEQDSVARVLRSVTGKIEESNRRIAEQLPEDEALIGPGHQFVGTLRAGRPEGLGTTWWYAFQDRFVIDRYPVTNKEYARFLEAARDDGSYRHPTQPRDKSHTPDDWENLSDYGDRPVVGVDWYDAHAFATWAGKRLPTEAEYEMAGYWDPVHNVKLLYPWGNEPSEDRCQNAGTPGQGVESVGTHLDASPHSVHDIAGNVWEWCADYFSYTPYSGSEWYRNPSGPSFGEARVIRGGSFLEPIQELSVRSRSRGFATMRSDSLGFRCARSLPIRPGAKT